MTANEVSGTVTIFAVNEMISGTEEVFDLADGSFRVNPNPVHDAMWLAYDLEKPAR